MDLKTLKLMCSSSSPYLLWWSHRILYHCWFLIKVRIIAFLALPLWARNKMKHKPNYANMLKWNFNKVCVSTIFALIFGGVTTESKLINIWQFRCCNCCYKLYLIYWYAQQLQNIKFTMTVWYLLTEALIWNYISL